MALSQLFSRVRAKITPAQVVSIEQLDAMLDVATDQFERHAAKLGQSFARQKATLDIAGYRERRAATASSAALTDVADLRGSAYPADLRRLPAMDREEEFKMARRLEFLRSLVTRGLGQLGVGADEAKSLATKPAREILEVVAQVVRQRPGKRGLDASWFAGAIAQLEDLRNLYVEGALYIVLGSVNRYRGLGVDTADLIQEGNASMFQAIDGFDWRRDVRFRTYAQYWVHQAILKMLYNSSRTVRVPIWVQKILGKIRRAQDAGRREGREPTHEEIGRQIGVSAERVAAVLATRRYAVSLDAEIGGEEGSSLVQLLADESLLPVPDSVPVGDLKQALQGVMADLPPREQLILRARFGLDGQEPQTLSQIGATLGVTAERVRQLQNAAMARIKRPGKLRQLQAFVE